MFLPIAGGMQGLGSIEPNGEFTVGTFGQQDGALVGAHHVMILNVTVGTSDDEATFRAADDRLFDVKPDTVNQFEIELKSNEWEKLSQ